METLWKKTKRLLSILLCLCMVLSLIPGIPLVASAATNPVPYDGTPVTPEKITSGNYYKFGLTDSNWSAFNGYYGIRNASELYGFANLVNGGTTGANAVLLQDIVVNETVSHTTNGAAYTWSPIGNSSRYYTGTFDGNGYTVSGLYYNENDYGQSISRIGFFGVVKGATIKNLILSNVYFRAASEVSAVAACVVNYGTTISNCLLTSSVTLAVDTSSDYAYTGGFIGNYYAPASVLNWNGTNIIKNCVNLGSVKLVDSSLTLGYGDTSWYYTGAIAGAYRSDSNAYEQVTAQNCYYLQTCVSDKDGATEAMSLGGTNNTVASGRGCTALKSASDSHTCVSMTHQEVKASCQYLGRSEYSFCLVCGEVTGGAKTETPADGSTHFYTVATCVDNAVCINCGVNSTKDPSNHAQTGYVYAVNSDNPLQHDKMHSCCNVVVETLDHSFDNAICTLCNYVCEHPSFEGADCTVCGKSGVPYISYAWDGASVVRSTVVTTEQCSEITSNRYDMTLNSGWYVVKSDATLGGIVTVSGTVNLILCNGAQLTVSKGIKVIDSNTLNIFVQSTDPAVMGKLSATGYYAAIGGRSRMDDEANCGNVTIYGGIITATGGNCGAGIGGGYHGHGGNVTIYSGIVTAKGGQYAAGIGAGYCNSGQNVTIYGGTVTATGGYGGAGIGGGYIFDGGSVTICGGTVTATGGEKAAGIGGGYKGAGANVVISGGNIKATAGSGAQAIGRGYNGWNDGALTDGNGNNVSCYTLTLEEGDIASAASIQGMSSYSFYDVQALDTNKVYMYLADSAAAKYVTIGDTVYCRGTSKDYSTDGHVAMGSWISDNGTHYKNCANGCGVKIDAADCPGGVATCLDTGKCTTCGGEYLPVDSGNHASEDTYLQYMDDEFHGVYHACCKVEKERREHTAGEAATCTGTAICADCGIAYGATDAANHAGELVYVSNGKQNHIQIWDCCRTPNTTPEPHTLTCTAEGLTITGVCDFCAASGTVTLNPSVGGTYNGYAFTSAYEGTDLLGSWDAFVKPTVSYCCEGGCKTAGSHTVTMTLGEASVSAEFTITPKTLTVSLVKASNKSYDGTSDLNAGSVSLDGIVVYDEGYYDGEWDDVRDDVKLVYENLVYEFDGILPGTYGSVDVSGVTITGNDATNYVIADRFEDVLLLSSEGFEFQIYNQRIWIDAHDQLLVGDQEIDQNGYSIEGLDEKFTIEGISLYDNGYSQIEIDSYGIYIYLDGEDVTAYFDIDTYPGNLARVCEGHQYDDNGFCATGECSNYEPAVRVEDVDEWGSEVIYYEIYNAGQLYWFAEQINTYGNNYIYGRLMADITVNEDLTAENLRQWTPIGRSWPAYCGVFEGNDYTVSGLYVNNPEMDYVGLFGYTDYAYPISNIHLTNSYFEGNSCVGGLVGYAGSNISGCTVSDSVTVKGYSSLGGIAGNTGYGELNNSWSAATVIADEDDSYYGGLVGSNCLSINNCYTTGSSLVGFNNESYGGSVNNSYYLSEEETEDGGKTAAQFASGEVAYLLQSGVLGEEVYDEETDSYITLDPEHIWGQYIGEEAYPVIGGIMVYQITDCQGNSAYSNTEGENLAHSGEIEYSYNNDGSHSSAYTCCGETVVTGETCTSNAEYVCQDGYCVNCNSEVPGIGHDWVDADCDTPKTCSICRGTEGEALGHTEETITGKAPTCTEPGLTDGVICSVCGETLTEQEEIPATGNHVDDDNSGRCDTCNCLMQPAKLCMVSISLKGNIALNYYMLLSDEVLSDSTAYMQFTMADGEIIQIPVSEGVQQVRNGETYYVFSCAVDAKEMTDDVISQFFYEGGSTKEHTYNVKTYADHILANSTDEEMKDLVTAMLNYGAASQIHFGYNTDDLANAELVAPDYSGVTIEGFNAVSGQGTELAKLYSASLILKSETTLRFFFAGAITATYNGQALEVKQRSGLYYVDVVGIAAKDLDENVTITINDGTNTAEVSFNPMSYCQGVLNDTTGAFGQEMKDLVSALYLYNQAANVYFKES